MRKHIAIVAAVAAVLGGAALFRNLGAEPPAATPALSSSKEPGTVDGHPDLSGYWNGGGRGAGGGLKEDGSVHASYAARDGDVNNFERDFAVLERSHPNKPVYKPEHWATIQDMDWNGLTRDPTFSCGPAGVPRIGAPDKIVQTAKEIVFLYDNGVYRVIPTDGRKHVEAQIGDTVPNGYSVGHWEGDTLVVDTIGFDDTTWLSWTGYVHSNEMRVTERISRKGDTLHWVATVEDPMLAEPWTMDPETHKFNANPNVWFWGVIACKERDSEHIVDRNVRG